LDFLTLTLKLQVLHRLVVQGFSLPLLVYVIITRSSFEHFRIRIFLSSSVDIDQFLKSLEFFDSRLILRIDIFDYVLQVGHRLAEVLHSRVYRKRLRTSSPVQCFHWIWVKF